MGLLHEVRNLHATVPYYYVSGIATSAPSTATRSPSPVTSGQRHPITLRLRLCSWDVFPYDLFPNQLRPTDLLLGQVNNRGGWNYGILASPVATGEVASAASR